MNKVIEMSDEQEKTICPVCEIRQDMQQAFWELASSLSKYKSEYNYYKIAKVKWTIHGKVNQTKPKVVLEKENYVRIHIIAWDEEEHETGQMWVTLLRSITEDISQCTPTDYNEKSVFTIKASEIQTYCKKIQDVNPIHQTDNPIVTGMMLVHELYQRADAKGWLSILGATYEIRFYHPLYANEPCNIHMQDERWILRSTFGHLSDIPKKNYAMIKRTLDNRKSNE